MNSKELARLEGIKSKARKIVEALTESTTCGSIAPVLVGGANTVGNFGKKVKLAKKIKKS